MPTTVDATFSPLSHPTRRVILERLGSGPATLSRRAWEGGLDRCVRFVERAG